MAAFVHLHTHTEYSLLDGAIRVKDLIKTAQAFGMPAVTITDHGNMHGVLEFYEKAKAAGIKPIIGCEVYVAPKSRFDRLQQGNASGEDRSYHLVLLARDLAGYQNLLKLVSAASIEGFYYKPRIDKELLRAHSEGLIGLSACLHGEVAYNLMRDQSDAARNAALEYVEILGTENFYLELQANGIPEQAIINEALIKLGRELGIPLVATNDAHYLHREDAHAHEILLCIQTGKTVLDEKRMKFQTDQLYFKSTEEMAEEFAHVPDALENTVRIADRCNVTLNLNEYHFPVFPLDPGESVEDRFEKMAREGFADRIERIKRRRPEFSVEDKKLYGERLDYELRVIKDMGFAAYFLIVADFINYGKSNGIPVGPGRGSAAGSLVAYSMKITDLDPIEHGLIFERFLNAERVSMPDIDVDFCIHGRERVVQYVSEKYGKDHVAQIATFGTMQARAVIRDVGRALALPYNEVDQAAKLVPMALGMTLGKAFELEPKLVELRDNDPHFKDLFAVASVLEGLSRHASTHAAGVVMSDKPIVEYMPLYKGGEGEIVTQFSMKYVEKAGLIKFDFLGLRNLTVIAEALNLIKANHGIDLVMEDLPLDDPETFALLCKADTTGVFQLESSGMRGILTRLKPENFADIVALVALYRPGPLESGMVDNYIQGKHGEIEVTYELEQLRPILEPTYGVILYQEQVMNIASVLANYTLGEADILRRAMGKKKPEEMAAQRDRFLSGAKENGIDPDKANHIFDLMEKFAGYGFNKSHSAAYALIAYHTAYLKAHYPVEFMAAVINSSLNNTDAVVKFISECVDRKIEVLPPDINVSNRDVSVVSGKIRFGLGGIKNVGDIALDLIMAAREKGPFTSIFDFCRRVESGKVNKRVLEQLTKCGAFDSLHPSRACVLASLDLAAKSSQSLQKDRASGQMNMFELLAAKRVESGAKQASMDPKLVEVPDWDKRLILQHEKETLGFYVSGHPLDLHADQMRLLGAKRTGDIQQAWSTLYGEERTEAAGKPEGRTEGEQVLLCGILSLQKEIITKKGDKMGFLTLEDREGTIEIVAFADTYPEAKGLMDRDAPAVIMGTPQFDEKGCKIIASKIVDLDNAQVDAIEEVHFHFEGGTDGDERAKLALLRHVLMSHPGDCKAFLHLECEGEESTIQINESLNVEPSMDFFQDFGSYFNLSSLHFVRKTPEVPQKSRRKDQGKHWKGQQAGASPGH